MPPSTDDPFEDDSDDDDLDETTLTSMYRPPRARSPAMKVGDDETPVTAFRIDPSRSRAALEALNDTEFDSLNALRTGQTFSMLVPE